MWLRLSLCFRDDFRYTRCLRISLSLVSWISDFVYQSVAVSCDVIQSLHFIRGDNVCRFAGVIYCFGIHIAFTFMQFTRGADLSFEDVGLSISCTIF